MPASGQGGFTDDEVRVYAAVFDRYLTGDENSFPERRFPHVFVLAALDPDAADPMRDPAEMAGEPISAADQERILGAMSQSAIVTFVTSKAEVTVSKEGCDVIRDDGIYIAVQPIAAVGTNRVEVGIHGYVACLGATWFTYVVQRDASGWVVTGTTGAMAVA